MQKKTRLDVAVFEQGYAPSREKAKAIIMAGIVYVNNQKVDKAGFELKEGDVLEVRGKTLQYVGIADRPDIYTLPFHNVNLTASRKLGREKKMQLELKIDNLLNDKKESVFKSFNPTDQFFTRLDPGITCHLKLSYALF